MELPSRVRPAGHLIYMVTVEVMKTCVAVGLESTPELLQMQAGMFTLAICGVGEPHRRRCLFAGWSVVPHISPQSAGLGLAVAGGEHWHRSIVGVQLAAGEHVLLNGVYQRTEQVARSSHPAGQRGARYLNPLAGINL